MSQLVLCGELKLPIRSSWVIGQVRFVTKDSIEFHTFDTLYSYNLRTKKIAKFCYQPKTNLKYIYSYTSYGRYCIKQYASAIRNEVIDSIFDLGDQKIGKRLWTFNLRHPDIIHKYEDYNDFNKYTDDFDNYMVWNALDSSIFIPFSKYKGVFNDQGVYGITSNNFIGVFAFKKRNPIIVNLPVEENKNMGNLPHFYNNASVHSYGNQIYVAYPFAAQVYRINKNTHKLDSIIYPSKFAFPSYVQSNVSFLPYGSEQMEMKYKLGGYSRFITHNDGNFSRLYYLPLSDYLVDSFRIHEYGVLFQNMGSSKNQHTAIAPIENAGGSFFYNDTLFNLEIEKTGVEGVRYVKYLIGKEESLNTSLQTIISEKIRLHSYKYSPNNFYKEFPSPSPKDSVLVFCVDQICPSCYNTRFIDFFKDNNFERAKVWYLFSKNEAKKAKKAISLLPKYMQDRIVLDTTSNLDNYLKYTSGYYMMPPQQVTNGTWKYYEMIKK